MNGRPDLYGAWRASLAALVIGTALASAVPAVAQVSAGVAALIKQAEFWKKRNRPDLARQALQRAQAIDPDNPAVRRALASKDKPSAPSADEEERVAGPVAAPRVASPKPIVARPVTRSVAKPVKKPVAKVAAPKRAAVNPADMAGKERIAGFAALEAGKLAVAETHFQRALKIDANDADALGGLGVVRLRNGRFPESRDLLTRASRGSTPGKWAPALQAATFYGALRTAQTARDAGRLSEAETLTRALAPSDARQDLLARTLLGDIFARQGRYAEAQQMYRSVPGSTGAAGAQAVADLQSRTARIQAMQAVARGDVAGAERLFQGALVAGTSDPWLRYDYARFLVAQGRGPAADAVMMPLSRAGTPDGYYAAALYNAQVGRLREANSLMTLIPPAQRTPQMNAFLVEQRANAAVAQARSLQSRGRSAEAVNGLRQLASQPLPVVAQGAVADALYTLGDTPSAVGIAQQALAQPLAEPDSYQGIITVLGKSGQDAAGADLIQRLAAASQNNPLNNRSVARLNALLAAAQGDRMRLAGDYATAFEVLQAAWASAPGDIDILASLARLYQAGNLHAQAVQVYSLLRQQRPNDVGTLIGLTDSSIGAGDNARAADAIMTALRLAPADADVHLAAARMEQARGKEGQALKYLKQARELHAREVGTGVGGGLFSPTNPFARNVPPPAAFDPFSLPSRLPGRTSGAAPQNSPAGASSYTLPVYGTAGSSNVGQS